MKKTLIALAVLAASGASFAQATISGSYIAGYRASTGLNATTTFGGDSSSGLGIDTSVVNFTATEDLGGGLKASAVMGFDGLNRGGVNGGDSGLTLTGNFGKIALATGRGGDYLSGGVSGVGGVGFDGKVFSTLTAGDSLGYTTPSFSGFTAGVTVDESAENQGSIAGGETNAVSPVGLGVGAAGTRSSSAYQRGTNLSLSYAAGPLAANLSYKVYDQQGVAAAAGAATKLDDNNSKNRISIAASYDLGVAKLGAGFRNTNFVTGTRQDSFLAVGVPLGALTLGADWGSRTQNDRFTATDNGTRTGLGLKAQYDLSKRTALIASYAKWDGVVGANAATTETNLLVAHSF